MPILNIPALPENWEGTPQELLDHISLNATLSLEAGNTGGITGQFGGSEPSGNVGQIWIKLDGYSGQIYVYNADAQKYRPISSGPLGEIRAFLGGEEPADFWFLRGQTKVKADYPEMAAVVGTNWNRTDDDPNLVFRLPDLQGRMPIGSGIGNYNPKTVTGDTLVYTGRTKEYAFGNYYGREWVEPRTQSWAEIPPTRTVFFESSNVIRTSSRNVSDCTPMVAAVNWMVRYR